MWRVFYPICIGLFVMALVTGCVGSSPHAIVSQENGSPAGAPSGQPAPVLPSPNTIQQNFQMIGSGAVHSRSEKYNVLSSVGSVRSSVSRSDKFRMESTTTVLAQQNLGGQSQ